MITLPVGTKFIESLQAWVAGTDRVIRRIGDAAVLHIKNRTQQQNVDRYGRYFKGYVDPRYKRYKGGARVNLYDTGDMLGNLQVIGDAGTSVRTDTSINNKTGVREASGRFGSRGNTRVVIGFPDTKQASKAYAHISGTSPQWKGNHKRDFMGLPGEWVDITVDREFTSYGPPKPTAEQINIGFKF
jgi:hypothetical protein